MTATELKKKYIEFFTGKGHAAISGSSLIPENDPTVLFTTAGMHPLVPYILGEPHPSGKRLVDVQKCIRTGDIDEVGDPSHLTFFEMLGNWSLGDYFKEEAIRLSYEFLTSPRWLGFDPETLSVTVFAGDDEVPADEEAAAVWRSLGIPNERIHFFGRADNWWGPAGQTGPCGPDTEMFIDTGIEPCGPECKPGCSCGKYFEVWNDVFMQYNKTADGRYLPLEQKTVDTGMGVERTCAMLQGRKNVYEIETFVPIIQAVEQISGRRYGVRDGGETDGGGAESDRSMRIITDHIRSATFILGDDKGVKPSNLGQGYILRRLIRRAIRHARKLGIDQNFLSAPAEACIEAQRDAYPELERNRRTILDELAREEAKFLQTLQKGEHEFEKLLPNLLKNPRRLVPGRVAFRLYDTYGFPIELTQELAAEHEMSVDVEGFQEAFRKHQELSKSGAEKTFKGGLADQSEMTRRLHTATHLMHQALRQVLGNHVEQKGSNITAERLRFDFSHPEPMTEEQIHRVEEIVNEQIRRDLPVSFQTMSLQEAREHGAIALFGERYEEKVKVYSVGDFSMEVCGGPHVERTGELGRFRIVKEQSSSAGVRRIRAVVE
ncbi:MAG: alanine--tRNA ligase [Spirochaetales bacterium]|nr:alanine--tRNA ligase [Spirochaetales bacterium]